MQAVRRRWPVVWSGGEDSGVRYAYFEPPGGQVTIIEFMELTDASAGLAKLVRDAAAGWMAPTRSDPSADNFPPIL